MKIISFPQKITVTWLVSIITIAIMTILPNTLNNPNQWNDLDHSEPMTQETSNLFMDLPDLLVVEVEFFSESSPVIGKISQIDQGRLTPDAVGEAKIEIYDDNNQTLYETTINPIFVFGEPPRLHEQISKIVILPNIPEAQKIIVSYKNWKVEKLIDEN